MAYHCLFISCLRHYACCPGVCRDTDPTVLEFFNMMIVADFGSTIKSIKLVDLTAEEDKQMEMGGKNMQGKPIKNAAEIDQKFIYYNRITIYRFDDQWHQPMVCCEI